MSILTIVNITECNWYKQKLWGSWFLRVYVGAQTKYYSCVHLFSVSLCLFALECEDHENGGLTLPPLLFSLPGPVLSRCRRKRVLCFHACKSSFTWSNPKCLPIDPGVSLHLLVLSFSCAKFKLPRYSFCLLWVASVYRPYQNQERWEDSILAF